MRDCLHRAEEDTLLRQVVQSEWRGFVTRVERESPKPLPCFVVRAFDNFVRCGQLRYGCAHFCCGGCALEHVVALSCKSRGFCSRCGGRRMTELAAHLIDRVLPEVPVRQWVLSVPWRVRIKAAYDSDFASLILRMVAQTLLRFYESNGGRGGAVVFVQRFGSALNLNWHLHVVALDGVFVQGEAGLSFVAAQTPSQADVRAVLQRLVLSLSRRRARSSAEEVDTYPDDTENEPSAIERCALAAASMRKAWGERAGEPLPRTFATEVTQTTGRQTHRMPCTESYEGFNLQAGRVLGAHRRDRREQLVRYALRPPLSKERLMRTGSGNLRLQLKTPWKDGTTHITLSPTELLARLAALVPAPHKNLLRYFGVLAPRARLRAQVVAHRLSSLAQAVTTHTNEENNGSDKPRRCSSPCSWATLMQRAFGIDVLSCPRCGQRFSLVGCVLEPRAVQALLKRLGYLDPETPCQAAARAPPVESYVELTVD